MVKKGQYNQVIHFPFNKHYRSCQTLQAFLTKMIVGQRHSRPIFASFFDSEIWPEHLPDYLSKAVPKDNFFFEVLCLFGLTLSKLTFFHTFLDHLFQGFSGNQDSLHVHFQICVGNLVWISNSNLHRFLVPLTHLNSPSSPLLIHPTPTPTPPHPQPHPCRGEFAQSMLPLPT